MLNLNILDVVLNLNILDVVLNLNILDVALNLNILGTFLYKQYQFSRVTQALYTSMSRLLIF